MPLRAESLQLPLTSRAAEELQVGTAEVTDAQSV